MKSVKWVEQFGCYRASLPCGFDLGFDWSFHRESPGYNVRVFGENIGLCRDIPSAKRAAITTARAILTEALEDLKTLEGDHE